MSRIVENKQLLDYYVTESRKEKDFKDKINNIFMSRINFKEILFIVMGYIAGVFIVASMAPSIFKSINQAIINLISISIGIILAYISYRISEEL